jgi:hypothetical protein
MIDFKWCTKKSTIAEAESKRMIDLLGIDESAVIDKSDTWTWPILPMRLDWKLFKEKKETGMDLWEFISPNIGDHRIGGYAWVSNNEVSHYIIVR